MEYYRVIPIAEGVYRLNSPENVYMELLVGTEKALLIDTGYGFRPLKRRFGRSQKSLFIS